MPDFKADSFTGFLAERDSIELPWRELSSAWSVNIGFRSDYARRQALLEIDVLVAMSLSLTIDQLIQIYNVQFAVMGDYEKNDEYDSRGQRLPNTKRKDAGGKEVREARTTHDDISPLTVSWKIDNDNQAVTKTFYPPFSHVDRIEDYRIAYRIFSERLGLTENKEEIV